MGQSVRVSGFWGCCGLAALGLWVPGCDDECKRGASECVTDSLIRVCVPSESGNEWIVTQCGPNETCTKPPAARSGGRADAGSDDEDAGAAPAQTQPACTGTCKIGAHQCVDDAVARYCANAGVWELQPCEVGKKCLDGSCVFSSDGAVQACMPNEKRCASDKVAKLCQSDGSGWLQDDCEANEICKDGACIPDPKSSCDDANTCLDNKTAVRCLGKDAGFQLVKCENDTYCEAGRCRGSVCALGSLCSASNQIRECVDGKSYKDTQCAANEVCQQNKDTADCVPLQCTLGSTLCGDPRDPMVDPKKSFTTCVNGVGSGVPEWVKGECSGGATCNPARMNMPNPCSQTCTKGAQRCASDPITGINDGWQECGDDGDWGPLQTCNPDNESRRQCIVAPRADLSILPKAVCAEPICYWIFTNASAGATGACSGTQLRRCQPDGTLSAAEDCEQGICRTRRSNIEADGRMPGACDTEMECKDGEEICANTSGTVTPRYRSCLNGLFSSELKTCDGDAPCYNTKDENGLRKKLCGASCSPGTRRCSGTGQIDECNALGQWRGPQRCEAGSCRTIGNNDAACVLECMPGAKLCTGASLPAPDNFHLGTAQEVVCSAEGLRGSPRSCETGTVCRVTRASVALGCVACIGPDVAGGNDEGTADSRCDPSDTKKVQDCAGSNSWAAGRSCSGNRSCVSPTSGTCGNCVGARNGSFECTESNIRAEPICDSCNVSLMGGGTTMIMVCSQANVAATANASSTTCMEQSLGAPSNWGGVDNCCGNAQTTAGEKLNASCTSLGYGAASAWGSTPDCCGNYQIGTGGAASFAYCE